MFRTRLHVRIAWRHPADASRFPGICPVMCGAIVAGGDNFPTRHARNYGSRQTNFELLLKFGPALRVRVVPVGVTNTLNVKTHIGVKIFPRFQPKLCGSFLAPHFKPLWTSPVKKPTKSHTCVTAIQFPIPIPSFIPIPIAIPIPIPSPSPSPGVCAWGGNGGDGGGGGGGGAK